MRNLDRLVLVKHGLKEKSDGPLCWYDDVADLDRELANAHRRIDALEALRPHWAKGFSDDSAAAQAQTAALASVWKILGVDNQTAAMAKLRELTNEQDV